MRLLALTVLTAFLAPLLAGCADPHYNLDVRNNTAEVVALKLIAQDSKQDEQPRIQNGRVSPGATVSMFTEGKKGEKMTLEARPDGQPDSEPAVLEVGSGLSSIDVYDAPKGSKSVLKMKEVRRP
jgi:hypothetical protein